jgi:hypothetical protein
MGQAQPTAFPHRTLSWIAVGAVFTLSLLWRLDTGEPLAANKLDPSWEAVLSWAIGNGKQFGIDIVHTYGPLGFLVPGASYYPDVYRWFLAGQVLQAALIAYPLAAVLLRSSIRTRLALLLVYAAWLPWMSASTWGVYADSWWLLYFASSTVLLSGADRNTVHARFLWPELVLGVGAAAISMIKFSMYPLAVAWLLSNCAAAWLRRDRLSAATLLGSFAVATVALWLACGQELAGFLPFIRNSLEVIAGYGFAMSKISPEKSLLGLALVLLSGGCIVVQMAIGRDKSALAGLFLLGCTAYIAWRAGFTRDHVNWVLPVLAIVPIYGLAMLGRNVSKTLWWTSIVLTLAASVLAGRLAEGMLPSPSNWAPAMARAAHNVREFSAPTRLMESRQDQWNKARLQHALPRIARRIGNDSMDVLMHGQGVALVNRFKYDPRPVFQSYSAYTPKLLELNRAHFVGPDAPLWVVLKLETIDRRLTMADDGAALLAIMRNYRIVFKERGYLLFKRMHTDDSAHEIAITSDARMGDWIDAPAATTGSFVLARFKIEPTLLGKLSEFVFGGAQLHMQVKYGNGKTRQFRVIPAMLSSPFAFLSVSSNNQLLGAMTDASKVGEIRKFRFFPAAGDNHLKMFSSEIRYGFGKMDIETPPGLLRHLPTIASSEPA